MASSPQSHPTYCAYSQRNAVYSSKKDYWYVMHREMAHHVLAAPLQEYLRCEGQSWWGGSNGLLLRGVIMPAGGTLQELGLPIGLMASCATRTAPPLHTVAAIRLKGTSCSAAQRGCARRCKVTLALAPCNGLIE